MFGGNSDDFESDKAKNVHQTEILVDLREAILQVARHFQSIDPRNTRVVSCCFWSFWSKLAVLCIGRYEVEVRWNNCQYLPCLGYYFQACYPPL